MTLLLSANLGFLWTELPLLAAIEAAADAGFGAVELHFPYATPALEVKAACTRCNIKLISINTNIATGPDGHFGLGALPGRQKEFRHLTEQAFAYAEASGASFVHVMAGNTGKSEYQAARKTFIDNLKWAAVQAKKCGLTLLLEPLNTIDVPGYFYSRSEQATKIIKAVGANNIKLMFDTYHAGMMAGDILKTLRDNFVHIGHIQIASVPGRNEPHTGEFNYSKFFAGLEELNYQGWIGCEYKPCTSVEAGLIWTEKLGVGL